ncbi:MAG: DUF542 domain-containing protein [Sphaerochaeta sp.]
MQNIPLSELVKSHPNTTTFLNERHIDYCCGGSDALYDAITAEGYEIEPFLAELDAFIQAQDEKMDATLAKGLYSMSVEELVSHLEATHHRDERQLLQTVDKNLLVLLSAHYQNHKDELRSVYSIFNTLRGELMIHFAQEEEEVFPLMKREVTKEAYDKIVLLEADHEAAGTLIKRLISETHDFTAPADGCPTYRATYALLKQLVQDIFLHIFKENSILFPAYEKGVRT